MSYDLVLFERNKEIKNYETFLAWLEVQTGWEEERDYNDVIGTAPRLVEGFMKLKKQFPPLNGPHSLSDEEAFGDAETERHLTDYSIGSEIIYAAFGWSVAKEAYRETKMVADACQLGFFDSQSGDFCCPGMPVVKLRNEQGKECCTTWNNLEQELNTLDSPMRGTSNRDNAFVTIWIESGGGEDLQAEEIDDSVFMQCMPNYRKPKGLLKKLFASREAAPDIDGYTVEVCTSGKIFATHAADKQQLIELFRGYYESHRLPDITGWADTGIL